jgi:prepilin-type N-terminal cleavage/methylation domain-containing protein
MQNRKTGEEGFTLIEMLVVVLIIGILAAIALPQYQAAVLKSRFATVMQNTKILKEAEERYYLINGEYTPDLTKLDISISGCDTASGSGQSLICARTNTVYHYVPTEPEVVGAYDPLLPTHFGRIAYRLFLHHGSLPDRIGCRVQDGNDKLAVKVCISLGLRQDGFQDWVL